MRDMVEKETDFIPPPEAPVFEPSEEEFADPLAYIAKIRPIAEKTGICKIRPPPDWQPPFAVDVDNFKFTPRLQRLNELEAKTRIKLNFLDSIAKFWELQGCRLRLPYVNCRALDLYNLNKIVLNEGGFELVCKERKWSRVATELGYPGGKGIGSQLMKHYERILWPYDVFNSGAPMEQPVQPLPEGSAKDKDYVPHGIVSRQAIKPNQSGYSRRSKRQAPEGMSIDITNNSELKKLQLYGPGPKFQGLGLVVDTKGGKSADKTSPQELSPTEGVLEGERLKMERKQSTEDPDYEGPRGKKDTRSPKKGKGGGASTSSNMTMRERTGSYSSCLIEMYVCHMCGKGDAEDCLLLCDGCDDSFHTFCLLPPLPEVPKGDWRCPKCLAEACSKPKDPFGFEQAHKEFTLESFGKMADQFKKDFFSMPVHMVPPERIEKEFWRLVSAVDEDVAVFYGADIHSLTQGSGFPTKSTKNLSSDDEEYVTSGWNLNNLAILEASVLHHINADISGMKVPWMYVGMCFSAFCWHNEDHWSYSINYLHWGEPKTWYGVSGADAELFEQAMKKQAPELFAAQPDLLHQLVTIMSPTLLMKAGIPIYRTNQCAGEFVVTFPRAYHAGFNTGYNFAEAVNFCPLDWLPMGRRCIEHYRMLHRYCVFSHEELVCKMAADPENLDLNMAAAVHKEMLAMVEKEKNSRKSLLAKGITQAEREAFELLPDDNRQCDHCKTTCFLSAITCPCIPNKLVCIHHVSKLCDCSPAKYCLRYRYTLDELPAMLHRLRVRAESFDNWASRVKNAISATQDAKLDISELKEMIVEADERNFPDNDLLQQLIKAIAEAERCAIVATQLINRKQKQLKYRMSGDTKYVTKINMDELQGFVWTVNNLCCVIEEAEMVQSLVKDVESFKAEAQEALEDSVPDSEKLQKLLDKGSDLDIELPEIPKLKQELIQAKWLDEVRKTLSLSSEVTLHLLRKLIDSGVNLAPHQAIEKAMTELQELLSVSERWEEKAKICLSAKPPYSVALVEALISESKMIPAVLPNTLALKDSLAKAKEWSVKIEEIQTGEHFPYLDVLETMANKGRQIPIRLEQLPQVESQVEATRAWRERAARTFLRKNSQITLIEMLCPRPDVGNPFYSKNKKRKSIFGDLIEDSRVEEGRNPAVFLVSYKKAAERELGAVGLLRGKNLRKQQQEEEGTEQGKYCVCKKGVSGQMLQCELCKDWFHTLCVPIPKSIIRQSKLGAAGPMISANQGPQIKEMKFMCPLCMRSRRPKLETILSLLVSLQKLPVRLPEGEALQCLTERAMNWQDKAKRMLATEEITGVFAHLTLMSQKGLEEAVKKEIASRTEQMAATAENLKNFPGSSLVMDAEAIHRSSILHGMPPVPTIHDEMDEDGILSTLGDKPLHHSALTKELLSTHSVESVLSAEHAYSSFSKPPHPIHPPPSKKHSRKSANFLKSGAFSSLPELPMVIRAQLEELLVEGDLLEVSLEERHHIWRILQATQPHLERKLIENFVSYLSEEAYEKLCKAKLEKKEKRAKRKLPEASSVLSQDISATNETKKKKKKRDREKSNSISKVFIKLEPKEEKLNKDKKATFKKEKSEGKSKSKKEKEEVIINVDMDEDDDEICSAKRCLQPAGDDINWVQCDSCEKWYHLLCIGMASQPNEEDEFICKPCVKRRAAQKAKQRQRAKQAELKASMQKEMSEDGKDFKFNPVSSKLASSIKAAVKEEHLHSGEDKMLSGMEVDPPKYIMSKVEMMDVDAMVSFAEKSASAKSETLYSSENSRMEFDDDDEFSLVIDADAMLNEDEPLSTSSKLEPYPVVTISEAVSLSLPEKEPVSEQTTISVPQTLAIPEAIAVTSASVYSPPVHMDEDASTLSKKIVISEVVSTQETASVISKEAVTNTVTVPTTVSEAIVIPDSLLSELASTISEVASSVQSSLVEFPKVGDCSELTEDTRHEYSVGEVSKKQEETSSSLPLSSVSQKIEDNKQGTYSGAIPTRIVNESDMKVDDHQSSTQRRTEESKQQQSVTEPQIVADAIVLVADEHDKDVEVHSSEEKSQTQSQEEGDGGPGRDEETESKASPFPEVPDEQVSLKADEPVSSNLDEPVSSNLDEPVFSNLNEPVSLKVNELVSLKVGDPVSSNVDEPASLNVDEPVSSNVDSPASLKVDEQQSFNSSIQEVEAAVEPSESTVSYPNETASAPEVTNEPAKPGAPIDPKETDTSGGMVSSEKQLSTENQEHVSPEAAVQDTSFLEKYPDMASVTPTVSSENKEVDQKTADESLSQIKTCH